MTTRTVQRTAPLNGGVAVTHYVGAGFEGTVIGSCRHIGISSVEGNIPGLVDMDGRTAQDAEAGPRGGIVAGLAIGGRHNVLGMGVTEVHAAGGGVAVVVRLTEFAGEYSCRARSVGAVTTVASESGGRSPRTGGKGSVRRGSLTGAVAIDGGAVSAAQPTRFGAGVILQLVDMARLVGDDRVRRDGCSVAVNAAEFAAQRGVVYMLLVQPGGEESAGGCSVTVTTGAAGRHGRTPTGS